MPRGYGGAYRIRPRQIFSDDEPTFGESFGRGIGRFLQDRAAKQQQTDEFENQVRDAGGEVIAPPSTMDRVRGIAGAIRRHLPGYDPLPEAEENLRRNPPQIGITPSGDMPPISGGAHGHRGVVDQPDTSRHYGIADEIERSVQKGPGGYEAIVPTAQGRATMEERRRVAAEARARAGKRSDYEFEHGIAHRDKMEEIRAGDDNRGLSPAEWDRREEIRAGHARDLKTTPTPASGNQTLAERRQRIAELKTTISGAQAIIPRNAMDRRIAMRDPAQKARIEQAERDLDEAQRELQNTTLPDEGGGEAPQATSYNDAERTKNADAPIEVVRQRAAVVKADALKKFPKLSKAGIAAYVRNVMKREGWNVE